jgi:site-specific DNA-methyltransferase (adenine-specific)
MPTLDRPWLMLGDCLERMREIPDGSVDMIAADLPYQVTACHWDSLIPFEPLWTEYRRIVKRNAAIVLTASQPFTSALVMSNPKMFRYEWIWEKDKPSNFSAASRQPLKYHESVLVFYTEQPTYNPIKVRGTPNHSVGNGIRKGSDDHGKGTRVFYTNNDGMKFPKSVQKVNRETGLHPTQKPVALMEYMIRTYTNSGDIVLDNCFGSGTSAIACINTGRRFIGIEKHEPYFDIGRRRIEAAIIAANQPAPLGGLFDAREAAE